ncbi:MAG TPA: YidC/Oxa1 family insertase periplasmic-domain containing protein [Phycisphaerae bacterium]|nr:YidC/Oxa1 family insertase periplasmic-domain containing protein [Phycisphaerae bacterium]
MENKNFFRALFWALLFFLIWNMIAVRIWPPPKPTSGGAEGGASADGTPASVSSNGTADAAPGDAASNGTVANGTAAKGAYRAVGADAAEKIVLGTVEGGFESPYRMQLDLSNRGASIAKATLSDHWKRGGKEKENYVLLAPLSRKKGNSWQSLAIDRLTIDGQHRVDLSDLQWTADKREANNGESAVFTATVNAGDEPVLKLTRTFLLPAQAHETLRSDLQVTLEIENVSDQEHRVIIVERGPVGLLSQGTFMPDQKVYAAWRSEGLIELAAKNFKEVGKSKQYTLYAADKQVNEPLEWYAGGNLFFTCTTCPVDAEGNPVSGVVAQVQALDLDGDATTLNDVTTEVTSVQQTIAPGETKSLMESIYIGPKDREAFSHASNSDYVNRDYMQQIKEGYGSCTFSALTDLMIVILNWLYKVTGNFGVAIIILVIVVRTLLHPITKKTQVNMVRMQKSMGSLQPKMEDIKRKHAGDNAKIQQEIMKLYREEGVNPMGQMLGCLPMFLQMPIWVALYSSLRNNVAMRGEPFYLWITDLTSPDCFYHFSKTVNVPLMGEMTCFHLLPILVGVMMFAQQKLMPRPKPDPNVKKTPQSEQAEQMQKIMPYMSFIMIFLFYKFPSGLNLYIMTSSLVGAAEQVYIRKHIKQKDLEGPKGGAGLAKEPKKPKSGPSFLEKLQQKAEEAQKQAKQRSGKKDRR